MPLPSTLRKTRRGTLIAVIAALASTVVALAYFQFHAIDRPHSPRADWYEVAGWAALPSLSTMFDYAPTLLAVGDSSATPFLVTDKVGWSLARDIQNGTGFVRGVENASPPRVPFIDRLDQDAANYYVDYVLVNAGRSDLSEPPERVVAAVGDYIKKVHLLWPFAKVIIVLPAPVPSPQDVAPNYPAMAEGIRPTAESLGAFVIDPVAQHWFSDVDMYQLLDENGRRLNYNGEAYIANKIVENLQQMGFVS
jgi:hypothetical protein